MNPIIPTLRKCGNVQTKCSADAQYAGIKAFSDTLKLFGWNKAQAARNLGVALNTVRSWCDGRTAPDLYDLHACEPFADAWLDAFVQRRAEIRRAA
jgi:hypothetical protein